MVFNLFMDLSYYTGSPRDFGNIPCMMFCIKNVYSESLSPLHIFVMKRKFYKSLKKFSTYRKITKLV